MSQASNSLYHPANKSKENTWKGFSWPALFFGFLWLIIKGLWAHAVIWLVVAIATTGLGVIPLSLIYAFIGNDLHRNALIKKGYLEEDDIELTSKTKTSTLDRTINERDLNDDTYKLFLIEKYEIIKNQTLEKYTAKGAVFPDLSTALEHFHKIDTAELDKHKEKNNVISFGKIGKYNYDYKEFSDGRVLVYLDEYHYKKEYKSLEEAKKHEINK